MDPVTTPTAGTNTQEAPSGGSARAQDQGKDPRESRLERATAFLEQQRTKGGGKPPVDDAEEGPAEDEDEEAKASEEGEEPEEDVEASKDKDEAEKKQKPSQTERLKAQRDRLRSENESLDADYRKVYGIASQMKAKLDDARAEIAHLRALMNQHGVDEDPQSKALREAQAKTREAERRAAEWETRQKAEQTRQIREQIDSMADDIVAEAQGLSSRMRIDAAELVDEFDLVVRRWEQRGRQGEEPKLSDVAKRLARIGNQAAVQRRQDPQTRAPIVTPRGGRGAPARMSAVPLKKADGSLNSDAIAREIERRRGTRAG